MKTKSLILGSAAVIVVASASVAWKSNQVTAEARSALGIVDGNLVSGRAELQRAEERLAALESEITKLFAVIDVLQNASALPKATPTSSPAGAGSKPLNPVDAIQHDPALQALQLAAHRASLATTYGPLFRRLGLTPAQMAEFCAIVGQREEQQLDLGAAVRAQGMSVQDLTLGQLSGPAREKYDTAQRQLLGEAGFRELLDYERTTAVRDMVSGLAGTATVAGLAFTHVQAEQLTQLLAGASSSYQKGGWANPADIDWALVDAQAAHILSAEQLALFQSAEPSGPMGAGARYLTRLNRLIDEAAAADAATITAMDPPKS